MANQNQNRTETVESVNPRWAEQFEKAAASLTQIAAAMPKPGGPLIPEPAPEDRKSWTTPQEAEAYDNMVGKDFYKLDPKSKKPVSGSKLYRVTHVYPEFKTANPNEFKARFVVEEFSWEKVKGAPSQRKLETCFNIYAKDFAEGYRLTAPSPEEVAASAE